MSFEGIKGQDRAVKTLTESLCLGRIFSNYLFVGPEGSGKFLTAKAFAKAVNCLSGTEKPCPGCISCRKIDANVHPDVFFVEPKGVSSVIGIDSIRGVIAEASLKPYEGKKKVFIINDAHYMNNEASNAFLKTLEEPPGNTIFILISRSEKAVLPTIASRCHLIKFFAAPCKLVKQVLKEGFGIDEKEAELLANFSSGRIGKAVNMKKRNLIEKKNRLIDSLVFLKNASRTDLSGELGSYDTREGLKENIEFLLSYFRDIFIYKNVRDEGTLLNTDRTGEVKESCKRFTQEELECITKEILTLVSYVDYNVNAKIIIDVLTNRLWRHYE
ncbi:MAG: DNA polymerase III subunit delta' [Candidatus Omnitrophica bacterium]|nr:DNA polymerase III subunit delta' [Candidatus Omnitrophota bacterium]